MRSTPGFIRFSLLRAPGMIKSYFGEQFDLPPLPGVQQSHQVLSLEERMAFTDALLPEFDHEMATTRKTLERVPEEKLGWKPHPKSSSLGQLSSHIVNMLGWA